MRRRVARCGDGGKREEKTRQTVSLEGLLGYKESVAPCSSDDCSELKQEENRLVVVQEVLSGQDMAK